MDLDRIDIDEISKKINKELLNKLLDFRDSLLLHAGRDDYFGRLVYDTRNKEFGFIIGPFTSIDPEKDNEKRLLLVTLGDSDFRVRYTRKHNVRFLKDSIDNTIGITSRQSINYYCKEQCIMECSDQCALFKFKNKHG